MAARGLTPRHKALMAVAGTSVPLTAGLALPISTQYLASFESLESVVARAHADRVHAALDDALAALLTLAYD